MWELIIVKLSSIRFRVKLFSGVPGWLEIEAGRIVRNEHGTFPGTPDLAPTGFVAPGFVDVHSHGGGGASFTEGADAARTILATHRSHGTTTMIASLVSDTIPALLEQVQSLAELVHSGELAGIHLEGPWISPARKGAHDPEKLSLPTPEAIAQILELQPGLVRMVTIAPELDHAMTAIPALNQAGIVAAIGHTTADFGTAAAAFNAGASGVTHLFNAMPDMTKRDPGPVLAAFRSATLPWLELVFDTHHVDQELAAFVCEAFPDRVVLITDAMAAASLGDGEYSLGGLPVRVSGGVARLLSDGAIAGSTITLSQAVRNAVANGISLGRAVGMVTANSAKYLGLSDVGRLTLGAKADLVELDATGRFLGIIE